MMLSPVQYSRGMRTATSWKAGTKYTVLMVNMLPSLVTIGWNSSLEGGFNLGAIRMGGMSSCACALERMGICFVFVHAKEQKITTVVNCYVLFLHLYFFMFPPTPLATYLVDGAPDEDLFLQFVTRVQSLLIDDKLPYVVASLPARIIFI